MLRSWVIFICLFVIARASGACSDHVQIEGELIQGGLVHGTLHSTQFRLFLNQTEVLVHENGIFILGFDRDAPSNMQLRLLSSDDRQICDQAIQVKQRQYPVQRIDGLAHKQVHPDNAALIRIRNESAAIRQARRQLDRRLDFTQGFSWPVIGPISGVYGSQRILNGQPRRPHYGVDIAVPIGTPVLAPAAGRITYCNSDMYFSGGTIVLDHGYGLSSSFLHLNSLLVEEGQIVKKGDLIGEVGATGRVTGAHLDWRMNWQGAYIDPQRLVEPMPLISGQTPATQKFTN